jgi:hypothetical protein
MFNRIEVVDSLNARFWVQSQEIWMAKGLSVNKGLWTARGRAKD